MNVIKKLAVKILEKELNVDRVNFTRLQETQERLKKENEVLQSRLLDMNKNKPNTVDIERFRDMRLSPDEKLLCEELGKTPTFGHILDKLSMRLVTGVVNRATLPTEEDLKLIRGQAIAYSYLLSIISGDKKSDKVNPLTGEVEHDDEDTE
jgi:hypothetical protein